ncbi:MAG: energy transducer TonB [Bacteroidota bacterium]
MKRSGILFLLFFMVWRLMAQSAEGHRTDADQMPYFPGCEAYQDGTDEKQKCSNLALVSFIAQNVVYPKAAMEAGLEGTVYVSFVIDPNGRLTKPEVLRDIGMACGEAAIEVLQNMPKWEPAIHQGKEVAVKLNLPIQFFLKDEEPDRTAAYKINWGLLIGDQVTKEELMENLQEKVLVRDAFGNVIPVSNLRFSYEKKRKYYEAQSTGSITKDMRKVVKKAKKGGYFVLTATLQEAGAFLDVSKVFTVVD